MIEILDKSKCCGCTACYSSCPKKCISMQYDEEGFLYPKVNKKLCVDCCMCEKVCPHYNRESTCNHQSSYYAVQHYNASKRESSTAGGAFTLIADYFIENGAVVYAVGYKNMVVGHKMAKTKHDLEELRGAKYVQSTLNDTFSQIKQLLSRGEKVLFVGTPCQVHGIKHFIGDSNDLYTIDLLCLGVSSPKLFAGWIDYLNKKYKSRVINVQFRNKNYGYATPNVRVYFENSVEIDQVYDSKVHANLFFEHYNVRPCCYECEYREISRVSDFTIGDFNEIYKISKKLDDDKGTTQLWAHTEKAKKILVEAGLELSCFKISDNQSNIVGGKQRQIEIPKNRGLFFDDVQSMTYAELIRKWEPRTIKGDMVGISRKLLNVMPFKTKLFQYIRRQKAKKFAKRVNDLNERD